MFNTPILYIIFNRLDTVQQTFPVIKKQKPKYLYIAADGARKDKEGELEKCQQVRDWVLSQIDWDCDVKTLFRDENLGCGKGPAEAITWFFNNVEQGIILEDDCLPSDSFFKYCEELLEYYKDDMRVWQISGTNRLKESKFEDFDYFFTNYPSEWGWATWKNRWRSYDFNIKFWENDYIKDQIKNIFGIYYEKIAQILDQTINNDSVSWWDYQWGFIKNINSGLTVTPCKNLVSNIGFGIDATHTFGYDNPLFNIPRYELRFPLQHPNNIFTTVHFEREIFELHFPISKNSRKNLLFRLLRKIKKIGKKNEK